MHQVLKDEQDNLANSALPIKFHKYYNTGINTAWVKVDKYFKLTDQSILYRAAIVLHPGCKFEYFEDKWAGYNDWIKRCRREFKEFYFEYAEKYSKSIDELEEMEL